MNRIILITPDELHNIVQDAVASGVGDAIAALDKKTPKEMNDFEAAEYLGISPITLRMWRCQKRGPKYHKTGRMVRYAKQDLDSFLKNSEVQTIDSLDQGHGTSY